MHGLELIPQPLLLLREGEKNIFSKVPLFLREGFRVSFKFLMFLYSHCSTSHINL